LAIASLPFLLPTLWMLSTALKTPDQIYSVPLRWWPNPITLENFSSGWTLMKFPLLLKNSLLIAGLSSLGAVLSSALVAYAFATLPARGKPFLLALMLALMMVPPTVTLLPNFMLMSRLGLVGSPWPLILPTWCANGFFVLMLLQFFRALPASLFESAELDGCNPWQTFRYIGWPLARPALATVAVFAFVASWNDFLGPLIYLSSEQATLSLGLASFQSLYANRIHYVAPMSLLVVAPLMLLVGLMQRSIETGLVAGSGLGGRHTKPDPQ
jgi:ABC-type glycerol-3-phosphate transport system permease component